MPCAQSRRQRPTLHKFTISVNVQKPPTRHKQRSSQRNVPFLSKSETLTHEESNFVPFADTAIRNSKGFRAGDHTTSFKMSSTKLLSLHKLHTCTLHHQVRKRLEGGRTCQIGASFRTGGCTPAPSRLHSRPSRCYAL